MVHKADTRDAARTALIERWDTERRAAPTASRIILTHMNKEVEMLNQAARQRLAAQAELGIDVAVQTERGVRQLAVNCSGGGDISRDNAPRADDRIVANRDTWKDDRAASDPNVRAYGYRPTEADFLFTQPRVARMVGGQDLNSRTDSSPFTDEDWFNIQDDAAEI